MAIITLTTDFGDGSRYVAQMKGVLLSRAPAATLIDLSHDIPPQDIHAAARLLAASASWYPVGTIHLAVVDPGVGTDRAIVAVEANDQVFVGPDNGLFGWLADDAKKVVAIDSQKFAAAGDSTTFHGRDLMAPVAAGLALGEDIGDFGAPHPGLNVLPAKPELLVGEDMIEGRIVEIDRYGNLITNIEQRLLADAPVGDRLRITCGAHETFGLQDAYGDQPPQTLVALIGSEGFAELAIVNGDAAEMLGAKIGDTVTMAW